MVSRAAGGAHGRPALVEQWAFFVDDSAQHVVQQQGQALHAPWLLAVKVGGARVSMCSTLLAPLLVEGLRRALQYHKCLNNYAILDKMVMLCTYTYRSRGLLSPWTCWSLSGTRGSSYCLGARARALARSAMRVVRSWLGGQPCARARVCAFCGRPCALVPGQLWSKTMELPPPPPSPPRPHTLAGTCSWRAWTMRRAFGTRLRQRPPRTCACPPRPRYVTQGPRRWPHGRRGRGRRRWRTHARARPRCWPSRLARMWVRGSSCLR